MVDHWIVHVMYLPLSGKLPAIKGSHEFIEDMLGLLEARHSLVEITKRQGWGVPFERRVCDAERVVQETGKPGWGRV